MSDETPAPTPRTTRHPKTEKAAVDPVFSEPATTPAEAPTTETTVVEPAGTSPATPDAATEVVEPAVVPGAAGTATGEVAPASAMAGQQVVYVQTPVPPRPRGNRVVGVLLALLGAVVFGVVYAAVVGLILALSSSQLFGASFNAFLGTAFFWVPILVFALGFILLVVIVNRAGWAAHVFGSLLLAFVVYFAAIGLLLLVGNVFRGASRPVTFAELAVNPLIIAAAIIAREVAIWLGLAIAARGRRVRARNVEARDAFDRELAEKKAEYERPAATTA